MDLAVIFFFITIINILYCNGMTLRDQLNRLWGNGKGSRYSDDLRNSKRLHEFRPRMRPTDELGTSRHSKPRYIIAILHSLDDDKATRSYSKFNLHNDRRAVGFRNEKLWNSRENPISGPDSPIGNYVKDYQKMEFEIAQKNKDSDGANEDQTFSNIKEQSAKKMILPHYSTHTYDKLKENEKTEDLNHNKGNDVEDQVNKYLNGYVDNYVNSHVIDYLKKYIMEHINNYTKGKDDHVNNYVTNHNSKNNELVDHVNNDEILDHVNNDKIVGHVNNDEILDHVNNNQIAGHVNNYEMVEHLNKEHVNGQDNRNRDYNSGIQEIEETIGLRQLQEHNLTDLPWSRLMEEYNKIKEEIERRKIFVINTNDSLPITRVGHSQETFNTVVPTLNSKTYAANGIIMKFKDPPYPESRLQRTGNARPNLDTDTEDMGEITMPYVSDAELATYFRPDGQEYTPRERQRNKYYKKKNNAIVSQFSIRGVQKYFK